MSGILFFSVLGISVVNYQVSRRAVRHELMASALPLTRDTIFSEIQNELMRPIFLSSLMANDTFLKDWVLGGERDLDSITKYLGEIAEKYGFFTTFFVSARTSNYYHQAGIQKQVSPEDSHDVWFYNFVDSGIPFDLEVDTNEAQQNELAIFINFRVEGYDGGLLGVTGVGLQVTQMARTLRYYRDKYGRQVFLVSPDGVIQVHPDVRMTQAASIHDIEGLSSVAPAILDNRGEPSDYIFERDGRTFLLTARYVPDLNWFLLVEQDESVSMAAVRENFIRTMALGLVASVITVLVTLWTVNYYQRQLEIMATTDELTKTANRRQFESRFRQAVDLFDNHGRPFSLVVMDIDGLKAVNDTHGHLEGDRAILTVADLARANIRSADLLARWGGDEFIILCQGVAERAASLAHRLSLAVAQETAKEEDGRVALNITVSCGVAQYQAGESLDSVLHRADLAMFQSKGAGKNQVSMLS